jgi:hypothetical protein
VPPVMRSVLPLNDSMFPMLDVGVPFNRERPVAHEHPDDVADQLQS